MAEHKRTVRMGDLNNGIAAHYLNTGHSIAWEKAAVTDRETNWHRRRIKEAIRIQKCQVRMNLDKCLIIHQSWKRFNFHPSCSSLSNEDHTGSHMMHHMTYHMTSHVTGSKKDGKICL